MPQNLRFVLRNSDIPSAFVTCSGKPTLWMGLAKKSGPSDATEDKGTRVDDNLCAMGGMCHGYDRLVGSTMEWWRN